MDKGFENMALNLLGRSEKVARKYNGREWNWWVVYNDHSCLFCHKNNIAFPLGGLTGKNQTDKGYWNSLYQVWIKHMKEYHPEILEIS